MCWVLQPNAFHFSSNGSRFMMFAVWPSSSTQPPGRSGRLPFAVGEALVIREAVVLDVVAIDDGDQVVGLMVRGGHCGLPRLAFLAVAVAREAEDVVVALVELSSERCNRARTRVPCRARPPSSRRRAASA